MIGSNCLEYLSQNNNLRLIGTHFTYPTEASIFFNTIKLDDSVNNTVMEFEPDTIIHCGALTHVDYCESHPDESYLNNVQAVNSIIELADRAGSRIVFMSTDYVFGGSGDFVQYREEDNYNPLSVYGKHKLISENLIKEKCKSYLILRFTNVYGQEYRQKSFINRLLLDLKSGRHSFQKFPSDQYGTPINAMDIARIISMMIDDDKSGIYHLAGNETFSRFELAKLVHSKFNSEEIRILPELTGNLNQIAARPLNSVLDSSKFRQEYPDFIFSSVEDYLNDHINE